MIHCLFLTHYCSICKPNQPLNSKAKLEMTELELRNIKGNMWYITYVSSTVISLKPQKDVIKSNMSPRTGPKLRYVLPHMSHGTCLVIQSFILASNEPRDDPPKRAGGSNKNQGDRCSMVYPMILYLSYNYTYIMTIMTIQVYPMIVFAR